MVHFHPLLTAGRRWSFSFALVKHTNPPIAVLQWEQMAVTDAADTRGGCSANQVKACSMEAVVWTDETAELQSLQALATSGSLKKRRKNLSSLCMMTSSTSWGVRSSKQFTAKRGGKQQCDVGSRKLTNSTAFF